MQHLQSLHLQVVEKETLSAVLTACKLVGMVKQLG
jgi:hypothetical protein